MGKILDAWKKLTGADPTEEQKTAIAALEAETTPKPAAAATPAPAGSDADLTAIKQQLADALTKQDDLIKLIGQEKLDREAGIKRLQEESDKKRKDEIDKLLETAKGDGRIEPKNEEKIKLFRTALEKDFETGKAIMDGLAKNPAFVKTEKTAAGTGSPAAETNPAAATDPAMIRQNMMEAAKTALKAEAAN